MQGYTNQEKVEEAQMAKQAFITPQPLKSRETGANIGICLPCQKDEDHHNCLGVNPVELCEAVLGDCSGSHVYAEVQITPNPEKCHLSSVTTNPRKTTSVVRSAAVPRSLETETFDQKEGLIYQLLILHLIEWKNLNVEELGYELGRIRRLQPIVRSGLESPI